MVTIMSKILQGLISNDLNFISDVNTLKIIQTLFLVLLFERFNTPVFEQVVRT